MRSGVDTAALNRTSCLIALMTSAARIFGHLRHPSPLPPLKSNPQNKSSVPQGIRFSYALQLGLSVTGRQPIEQSAQAADQTLWPSLRFPRLFCRLLNDVSAWKLSQTTTRASLLKGQEHSLIPTLVSCHAKPVTSCCSSLCADKTCFSCLKAGYWLQR